VSKNKLKRLSPNLKLLTKLKSLNCDENKLQAGSLAPVTSLNKLQTLSAGGNQLGKPVVIQGQTKSPNVLPKLPPSLKQLKLDFNFLSNVPKQIFSSGLVKLEKLDLSKNMLAAVPGVSDFVLSIRNVFFACAAQSHLVVDPASCSCSLYYFLLFFLRRN
jgi:Leucine-rich repeat (LRR) protein